MTASEHHQGADHDRSLGDRALDLLVYAPAGVVLTVLDDFPELATRGRARLEQELHNAEFVGRIAVQMGLRELRHQVESLVGVRGAVQPGAPAPERHGPAGAPRTPPATQIAVPEKPATGASGAVDAQEPAQRLPHRPPPAPGAKVERDAVVDRAIPDYDTLSASQVVRRLDGLSTDELQAVIRHELATRDRRTIIHRAEQLLTPDGPDTSNPS